MVNPRTFDLNLLRVFEALSLDRSVSIAAAKLGMTQPAVSNALNRLRVHFDDPLFVRTRHGMTPTPKAALIAESFHQGLTVIRSGFSAATEFDPSVSDRRFNLLMTDVGEISFLPYLLAFIARSAPNIDITVHQADLDTYEDLLESGIADLAIGRIKLGDKLCSELIHSSPFVVLAARTNRHLTWNGGAPAISLEHYLEAPHLMIQSRGASGKPLAQALGSQWNRLRIALALPHTTALPLIIEGTDLIATVPKIVAEKFVKSDALCFAETPFPIEQNFVYQWWHRRNSTDAANRWLRRVFASAGV
jgi:DNA-binding transcriptional LysR family regulator